MESYRIENLTFRYPASETNALENISFTINEGEFVTICGKSGCGKSTLLSTLKPSAAPHGEKTGKIFFKGESIENMDFRKQSGEIGFVTQNPDNQIVTDKVWHELAFGAESLGMSSSEIRVRVSETASFFGIQTWFHKAVTELSGGQKQLLNLASVMVMQPSVLILDEPTSQLDPIAAQDFLEVISRVNRELGITVILSEHRLEEALAVSDRVIVMDSGRIIAEDTPGEAGKKLKEQNHDMFTAMPTAMRVYAGLENDGEYPVTVRDGRVWLDELSKRKDISQEIICEQMDNGNQKIPAVELDNVFFRYERTMPDVIKGLSVRVNKGELYAILGGNGVGKTTTLSIIGGLNKPYRGKVRINGKPVSENILGSCVGMLPQNPQTLFVKKTVFLDLCEMLSDKKISKTEKESAVREVVELCELEELLDRHPYDLSGGEQQRAALAKLLLLKPEILLLDEPTKGLDMHFKIKLADILNKLKSAGVTIIMVSHDIEFCAEYADKCAMFFDGNIVSEGKPREFFSGKSFYTTAANRMARQLIPQAVTAEDIILVCGGTIERRETENKILECDIKENQPTVNITEPKKEKTEKSKLSSGIMSAMLLIAVPLTIFAGKYFFGDRKYYFISLLIILEIMVPFFISFERRKAKVSELVIISVLCAIAVAGRAAFYMLPQFKPVAALVIIVGVALGGETGFLVGAVTAFVSNFFFGQGPWTPWQMLAFGLIGFIAGALSKKGILRKTRVSLCIFGALATLIIYGGIMNPASVIMWQSKPDAGMFLASYAMGLPFDLIHAASTAVFLLIASVSMLEKLERIKVKFGITATAQL